jgi:hypothetical protein
MGRFVPCIRRVKPRSTMFHNMIRVFAVLSACKWRMRVKKNRNSARTNVDICHVDEVKYTEYIG